MSKENLYNEEAIKKIKDIAKDVDYAMMATQLSKQPLSVIPMSTKKVDDQGNIWFISGADSEHNANIKKNSATQLLYSSGSDMKFLSIYGRSEIITKNEIIKELYGKTDDTWLNGPEDPNTQPLNLHQVRQPIGIMTRMLLLSYSKWQKLQLQERIKILEPQGN